MYPNYKNIILINEIILNNRNQSEPFQINLTASCNFGCECDVNDVQPVCGANGLTYFSPCHAGCTDVGSTSDNYTNCACKFSRVYIFIFISSILSKSYKNTIIKINRYNFLQMPVLMVVLRSVEEEAKTFALGIQFVIYRLFGYIPTPILFWKRDRLDLHLTEIYLRWGSRRKMFDV